MLSAFIIGNSNVLFPVHVIRAVYGTGGYVLCLKSRYLPTLHDKSVSVVTIKGGFLGVSG